MSTKFCAPRLAAGLAAAALLAAGCGPARSSRAPQPPVPIPALAASDTAGAGASMGLAAPSIAQPARVEYRVHGTLPSLPTEAPAYRLTADTTSDRVSRLASAFGVNGTVRTDAQGWTVTSSGSEVHVEHAAGLPWQDFQTAGAG